MVIEIRLRKMGSFHSATHKTPMEVDTTQIYFSPSRDDIRKDIIDLRSKWEKEGYYFGVGRTDLRVAEAAYDVAPGRPVEECLAIRESTRALIREHHDRFQRMQGNMGERLTALGLYLERQRAT